MSRVVTPATTQPAATPKVIPRERIAQRAYEKWLQRGCNHGYDLEDWTQAEAELLAEENNKTRNPQTRR